MHGANEIDEQHDTPTLSGCGDLETKVHVQDVLEARYLMLAQHHAIEFCAHVWPVGGPVVGRVVGPGKQGIVVDGLVWMHRISGDQALELIEARVTTAQTAATTTQVGVQRVPYAAAPAFRGSGDSGERTSVSRFCSCKCCASRRSGCTMRDRCLRARTQLHLAQQETAP